MNRESHKKEQILDHNIKAGQVWNSGGENYEEISRKIADAIDHCIQRVDPRPGELILDLATGTGWGARRIAERGARVIGLDFGKDLIETARKKAQKMDSSMEFIVGDAEDLPFEDGTFDKVVSTFGIMFTARPEIAAKEAARVCKKGGLIGITAWTPDSNVFEMFKVMKPYMAPPAQPAPPSPFEWGKRERVMELLNSFFDLKFEKATSFYREPSGEMAWENFSKGYGPTKSLVSSLDKEKLKQFKQEFIAFHEKYVTELGICVPRDYLLSVGTRR